MNVLCTQNLKKYYGSGENLVKALDGVNLEVERGEFVAIVGTSGSGKSTLLHMLGGLDHPTEGKVFVDEKDISGLKDDALCVFRRRKIGFVFQSYNLVPVLNVYENIVLPIELDGNTVDKNYVEKVIAILGLSDRIHRLPASSQEDSSKEWLSQELLPPSLLSCWRMNLPETWIPRPARMF